MNGARGAGRGGGGEEKGGQDAGRGFGVASREWELVHLHLNRVAWRCLTLKMVSVYYPLQSLSSLLLLLLLLFLLLLLLLSRSLSNSHPSALLLFVLLLAQPHRHSFLPRSFESCP